MGDRYQVISEVIQNLSQVLATVDEKKSVEFDASVDELQKKLVSGLAEGRDPIAGGAIPPLASAESDLTEMLVESRRPVQGVLENLRPLATEFDNRKAEVNRVIEPLAENYLRLNSLGGAYGSYFNYYICTVKLKFNGPAGGDIFLPIGGGVPDPSKGGRCSDNG